MVTLSIKRYMNLHHNPSRKGGRKMNKEVHILIVDDDRSMAKTLADIFRSKGYLARPANSAKEALKKIEKGKIDCVLSDIRMPEVSGVELCRAIKEKNPELPVVLMTAYSDDRLLKESLEEGALAVLPKPLDIHALLYLFPSLHKEHSVAIADEWKRAAGKGFFSNPAHRSP